MPGADSNPTGSGGGQAGGTHAAPPPRPSAPPPSPGAKLPGPPAGGERAVSQTTPEGGAVMPGDGPEGIRRRWNMGWLMIGAMAVVVISLFLPWIAADPDNTEAAVPKSLHGYEFETAWAAAVIAIGLGVYGWQGIGRPKVRFHVLALIALVTLLFTSWLGAATADDSVVERLDAGPGARQSSDDVFANANVVEARYGAGVAGLAGLVAIVPLTVLWRDTRRRRKQLELAAEVAATAAQRAPGAPPPPAPDAVGRESSAHAAPPPPSPEPPAPRPGPPAPPAADPPPPPAPADTAPPPPAYTAPAPPPPPPPPAAERAAPPPPRPAEQASPGVESAPAGGGRLDLNAVSFEQLRELGLSITQAKRIVAQREQSGGFSSLDELDSIPGLPAGLVRELKSKLEP